MDSPENFVLVEEHIFEDQNSPGSQNSNTQRMKSSLASPLPKPSLRKSIIGRMSRDSSPGAILTDKTTTFGDKRPKIQRRIVKPDEIVCAIQAQWKVTTGRLLLQSTAEAEDWQVMYAMP